MRLDSDLLLTMLDACQGRLRDVALGWLDESALTVVMATKGYPGSYPKGTPIYGAEHVTGAKVCVDRTVPCDDLHPFVTFHFRWFSLISKFSMVFTNLEFSFILSASFFWGWRGGGPSVYLPCSPHDRWTA